MSEERIGRLEGLVSDLAAQHARMAGTLSLIRESQERMERHIDRDNTAVRMSALETWRTEYMRTQDKRWQVVLSCLGILGGAVAGKLVGWWPS